MIGRFLGIDHGIKRIGIALSDGMGITAREITIIHRTHRQADFEKINKIAAQENVVAFVIGIPYNANAPEDVYTQADTVRLWIERFSQTSDLPIITWDEQLTSEDAKVLAKQQKRKPSDHIDDLAARLILQNYLDALSDGLATLPPSLRDES